MSDQEDFLKRWSRRKREIAEEKAQPDKPAAEEAVKPAAQGVQPKQNIAARRPDPGASPVPEFDVSSLPSIESIGANSDISAFLQAGVPSPLRHAALRRAWVMDPAIRDYIGLAENAWDFTDPNAMPGFGALDPQFDIKRLVAEIFGDAAPPSELPADTTIPAPAAEQPARLPDKSAAGAVADVPAASKQTAEEPRQVAATSSENVLLQRDVNTATQHDDRVGEPAAAKVRRHGSAVPH